MKRKGRAGSPPILGIFRNSEYRVVFRYCFPKRSKTEPKMYKTQKSFSARDFLASILCFSSANYV
jgi:hypothetical protein